MQNFTDFFYICSQTRYLFEFIKSYDELYRAYVECHRSVIEPFWRRNGSVKCWPEFDCITCWPPSIPNRTVVKSCSNHVTLFDSDKSVHRQCSTNGTWERGAFVDYSHCVASEGSNLGPVYLFIAGYAVSIVLLSIATFILGFFRQLRCDRNQIHLNLFTSFILNGLCWIVNLSVINFDANVLTTNPWWCQAMHVLAEYLTTCNFFWMFCEGFFLHTVLVLAFHTGKNLLRIVYVIGWVVPAMLTAVYAGLRAHTPEEGRMHCWVYWNKLQWINYGPIIAALLSNVLFLANIVRVIVTKLRAFDVPTDDTSTHTRKAVRATVILVPLLGVQLILMPVQPQSSQLMSDIYHYSVAALTSLQGACVALIYCFFNGEVLSVLRRRWNQLRPLKSRRGVLRGLSGNTITTYTENVHNIRDSAAANDIKDIIELKPLNHSSLKTPDT